MAAADLGALLDVVGASLVVGVGVTAIFSLAITGFVRFADLRGEGRPLGAWLFGLLGVLALLTCIAAVAAGIFAMTQGG